MRTQTRIHASPIEMLGNRMWKPMFSPNCARDRIRASLPSIRLLSRAETELENRLDRPLVGRIGQAAADADVDRHGTAVPFECRVERVALLGVRHGPADRS